MAISSWNQALEIDPDFREALHNLHLAESTPQFDVSSEIPEYEHGEAEEDEQEFVTARTCWTVVWKGFWQGTISWIPYDPLFPKAFFPGPIWRNRVFRKGLVSNPMCVVYAPT